MFCHDVRDLTVKLLSCFGHFVIVSCSRVCLPVVSRLHGLILRPFAPVCRCHHGDWANYLRYDSQNSLGASLQFKIR